MKKSIVIFLILSVVLLGCDGKYTKEGELYSSTSTDYYDTSKTIYSDDDKEVELEDAKLKIETALDDSDDISSITNNEIIKYSLSITNESTRNYTLDYFFLGVNEKVMSYGEGTTVSVEGVDPGMFELYDWGEGNVDYSNIDKVVIPAGATIIFRVEGSALTTDARDEYVEGENVSVFDVQLEITGIEANENYGSDTLVGFITTFSQVLAQEL